MTSSSPLQAAPLFPSANKAADRSANADLLLDSGEQLAPAIRLQ